MDDKKIIFVLIVVMIVFALLFAGIIVFILQYRKARLLHMEEMMKTRMEIQDQTLTHVGRELHDNIGQLLTVAKIHVNTLLKQLPGDGKVEALDHVVNKAVGELKALSKSLNNSRIADFGLHRELAAEVERLQRVSTTAIQLNVSGEVKPIPVDQAILLYRILQEFLTNSLKYAEASTISILLDYRNQEVQVSIYDNGRGFDMSVTEAGSGISNIRNRAKLLQAKGFNYTSSPYRGTHLSLTLPLPA